MRPFQLLGKLDNERAIDEESLVEVAVCLSAIDNLLGVEDNKKKGTEPTEGEYVPPKVLGASKKLSMRLTTVTPPRRTKAARRRRRSRARGFAGPWNFMRLV
jgi:hypothetical protein